MKSKKTIHSNSWPNNMLNLPKLQKWQPKWPFNQARVNSFYFDTGYFSFGYNYNTCLSLYRDIFFSFLILSWMSVVKRRYYCFTDVCLHHPGCPVFHDALKVRHYVYIARFSRINHYIPERVICNSVLHS